MENMIKIFESEEFGQIRTVIKNGEPLFCLLYTSPSPRDS